MYIIHDFGRDIISVTCDLVIFTHFNLFGMSDRILNSSRLFLGKQDCYAHNDFESLYRKVFEIRCDDEDSLNAAGWASCIFAVLLPFCTISTIVKFV